MANESLNVMTFVIDNLGGFEICNIARERVRKILSNPTVSDLRKVDGTLKLFIRKSLSERCF